MKTSPKQKFVFCLGIMLNEGNCEGGLSIQIVVCMCVCVYVCTKSYTFLSVGPKPIDGLVYAFLTFCEKFSLSNLKVRNHVQTF